MLFFGVFCVCLSVAVFSVILAGTQNPNRPGWACNHHAGWTMLILVLAAVGLGFTFDSFLHAEALEKVESLIAAGLTFALIRVMAPKIRNKAVSFSKVIEAKSK